MTPRQQWFHFAVSLASAVLTALLTRYGIPIQIPALPVLPAQPPIVIQTPPIAPPQFMPPMPMPPAPQQPPAIPPAPQQPQADPVAAICRLSFTGVGCTATVIGPRRPDGRWDVLTACHCTKQVGQTGTIKMKDGRSLAVRVKTRCQAADCAWMITEDATQVNLPFAWLAPQSPPAGTPIYHCGYGVDKPGNTENGSVTGGPDQNGQLQFTLSVSSGDSGGGIIDQSSGRLVSCVCCTTQKGARAKVWGACPEAIANCRTSTVEY